jgi:hypothetical protein
MVCGPWGSSEPMPEYGMLFLSKVIAVYEYMDAREMSLQDCKEEGGVIEGLALAHIKYCSECTFDASMASMRAMMRVTLAQLREKKAGLGTPQRAPYYGRGFLWLGELPQPAAEGLQDQREP